MTTTNKYPGKFLVLEGMDGSGKGTVLTAIKQYVERQQLNICFVRDPGTCKVSEAIRSILLDSSNINLTSQTEFFLYLAARSQLAEEIIKPALKSGQTVISDRWEWSTTAYQGALGLSAQLLDLIPLGNCGLSPDSTLYLNCTPKQAIERLDLSGVEKDRIEKRKSEFFDLVYAGYLKCIEKTEPTKVKIIDAANSPEIVAATCLEALCEYLAK